MSLIHKSTLLALVASWILASIPVASAAPGDHVSSLGFAGPGGVATSAPDGRLRAAGTFFGTVDFGGGNLTSMGMFTPDFFAVGWDTANAHEWSFAVPHANGFGGVDVAAIVVDASGSTYIGGRIYDGDIDFGGGSLFGPNLFVLKLNAAGAHAWSATFGNGNLNALDVSSAGLAITGSTSSSVDFGGGSIASAGAADAFYAVLDASGGHLRSAGFGDAANDQIGQDIQIDPSGNIAMAGGMQGTVDFGGGSLVAAAAHLFLASFDATGTHLWSKVIAGSFAGGSPVVQVEPHLAAGSQLAVAGEMRGSVDFGGGSLSSNGQADIYVATFDPTTGAHQWSQNWGAATSEFVQALSQDSDGNLIASGTMLGSFDAGGGALAYDAFSDLFAMAIDATGTHLWSRGFGTSSSDFTAENTVDASGEVLLWGIASGGIDFGGGALAAADLFLVRFEGSVAAAAVPSLAPIGLLVLGGVLASMGVGRLARAR